MKDDTETTEAPEKQLPDELEVDMPLEQLKLASATHSLIFGINTDIHKLAQVADSVKFFFSLLYYAFIGAAVGWFIGTILSLF